MNHPHKLASASLRFNARAHQYERHADIQRHAARELALRIARLPLPDNPRILEIGCGTGLLTRELAGLLGQADWTITDIAPAMLEQARKHSLPGTARYQLLDGENPQGLAGRYDLICSSLAVQWFTDLEAGLARLAQWLAPFGHLAIATLASGTFHEWRQAHQTLGLACGVQDFPAASRIGSVFNCGAMPDTAQSGRMHMTGGIERQLQTQAHDNGLSFLRSLKAIGATAPNPAHTPLNAAQLRSVLHQFDKDYDSVTYDLAYGLWQRTPAGVFVTGTDTGVGKTLTSAILARAWNADYWKPLQTGLAEEAGDTATVAALASMDASRLHAPAHALQAPLAPLEAARLEGKTIDMADLQLPRHANAPLVVEGAGGLFVPINEQSHILDLIAQLGLPVILVARSGLGTINHTLLSLAALSARRIPVLGVVVNGPLNPDNCAAIAHFGKVRILGQIPLADSVDAAWVDEHAAIFPSWDDCCSPHA